MLVPVPGHFLGVAQVQPALVGHSCLNRIGIKKTAVRNKIAQHLAKARGCAISKTEAEAYLAAGGGVSDFFFLPFFFPSFFGGASSAKEMETAPSASDRPSINVINFFICFEFSLKISDECFALRRSSQCQMNVALTDH